MPYVDLPASGSVQAGGVEANLGVSSDGADHRVHCTRDERRCLGVDPMSGSVREKELSTEPLGQRVLVTLPAVVQLVQAERCEAFGVLGSEPPPDSATDDDRWRRRRDGSRDDWIVDTRTYVEADRTVAIVTVEEGRLRLVSVQEQPRVARVHEHKPRDILWPLRRVPLHDQSTDRVADQDAWRSHA